MYVIAGLGNPGSRYANTRHNVGFETIDYLADYYGLYVETKKFKALIGQGRIEGQAVVLVKPQTYMNLSGESLREVVDFYKIDPAEELIVIHDDIALPPGQLRLRGKGSAGGHNGIKNIIQHLGTDAFLRVRIGVGEKPADYDLADYVLGHFQGDEKLRMEEARKRAAKAAVSILTEGLSIASNTFNKKLDA